MVEKRLLIIECALRYVPHLKTILSDNNNIYGKQIIDNINITGTY